MSQKAPQKSKSQRDLYLKRKSDIVRSFTRAKHEIDLELAERRFKELREAREARHKKREENLERIDPNYAKRKEERAKKSHRVEKFRSMDEHKISLEELEKRLETSYEQGLSDEVAEKKQKEFGPNVLTEKKKTPWYVMLAKDATGLFQLVLFGGAGVSMLIYGIDSQDPSPLVLAIAVICVVIVTTGVTFYQTKKSEAIIESFKHYLPEKAKCLRNGKWSEMDVINLVPGDIVEVTTGNKIPGDIRILESQEMKVDNSSLTGESDPLLRTPECTHPDHPLETMNLAFFGTTCKEGTAKGVVISTGDNTVIGEIASLAAAEKAEDSLLTQEINRFVLGMTAIAFSFGTTFLVLSFAVGDPPLRNISYAAGIIVANLPEGLLALLTICITIATQRLAKAKVLVKNLLAVETLGAINVICSDKTGTLTQNKMTVANLWYDGKIVRGVNYQKTGKGSREPKLAAKLNKVENDEKKNKGEKGSTDGKTDKETKVSKPETKDDNKNAENDGGGKVVKDSNDIKDSKFKKETKDVKTFNDSKADETGKKDSKTSSSSKDMKGGTDNVDEEKKNSDYSREEKGAKEGNKDSKSQKDGKEPKISDEGENVPESEEEKDSGLIATKRTKEPGAIKASKDINKNMKSREGDNARKISEENQEKKTAKTSKTNKKGTDEMEDEKMEDDSKQAKTEGVNSEKDNKVAREKKNMKDTSGSKDEKISERDRDAKVDKDSKDNIETHKDFSETKVSKALKGQQDEKKSNDAKDKKDSYNGAIDLEAGQSNKEGSDIKPEKDTKTTKDGSNAKQNGEVEPPYDIKSESFRSLHETAVLNSVAVFNEEVPAERIAKLDEIKDHKKKEQEKEKLKETYLKELSEKPWIDRPTIGDASESALIKFYQSIEDVNETRNKYPILKLKDGSTAKLPFNSKHKFALTIVKYPTESSDVCAFLKGAPERVWNMCSHVLCDGKEEQKEENWNKKFEEVNQTFGKKGQRVLGFAKFHLPKNEFPESFQFNMKSADQMNFPMDQFRFCGLISLIDPPKEKVPYSVLKCKAAGIKVIMVTGDQPVTATAIARDVNIIDKNIKTVNEIAEEKGISLEEAMDQSDAIVIHGDMLTQAAQEDEALPEVEKGKKLKTWLTKSQIVFARTTPAQKLLIVAGNQNLGNIVAVTGDGVNDSPAIKKSDIGIAMGRGGSQVARDAADMVLLNDDFSSIIEGIKEGRKVMDNLKRCLVYVLTSNLPELIPFISMVVLGFPLPLSNILMLCINIGTDLFPSFALAWEDAELDLMTRKPRHREEHLFTYKIFSVAYFQMGWLQVFAAFLSYFAIMNDFGFLPWGLFYKHGKRNALIPRLEDPFDPFQSNLGNSRVGDLCDEVTGHPYRIQSNLLQRIDWQYLSHSTRDLRNTFIECDGFGGVQTHFQFTTCGVRQLSAVTNLPICYTTEALKYTHTGVFFGIVFCQFTNAFAIKTKKLSVTYQGFRNTVLFGGLASELALMFVLSGWIFLFRIFGSRDVIFYHFGLSAVPFSIMQMVWEETRKYATRKKEAKRKPGEKPSRLVRHTYY